MRSRNTWMVVASMMHITACCRAGAATHPYTAAELEKEERVQLSRAGAGFTSVIVAPFVVIGNGPPSAVRDDAAQTVAWARDLLKRDYFARDPGAIISIWVFRDEGSYRSGISAIFGSASRDTPYGYYSPCERALIMNVGYGYGTLVHEMVHAYMDANFPEAPVWFNEGLASLYEQPSCHAEPGAIPEAGPPPAVPTSARLAGDLLLSHEKRVELSPSELAELACVRHGHIQGDLNWRLPALKKALGAGLAPSFERMASAGRGSFDGREGSLLYATARYLLYWLQEKGVLVRYFHAFRNGHAADSSGMRVLSHMLGRSLSDLRHEWEGYVAGLGLAR